MRENFAWLDDRGLPSRTSAYGRALQLRKEEDDCDRGDVGRARERSMRAGVVLAVRGVSIFERFAAHGEEFFHRGKLELFLDFLADRPCCALLDGTKGRVR